MAGFWHLSHHQMRDPNGRVLAGAKAYFYAADTLLPLTIYQDYGLGTPHPNPVEANAFGIFPPVFLDETDGFYRQRVATANGVLIPGTDVGTLPIIGPSVGGGGAEVPVDPNSLLKTGDPLWVPISGIRPGFVRMNGRSIGSAVSGASERANADCELLYLYNWNNYSDAFCPVTGGRGVSASADWTAGKPITLLDMRNKGPFGLDTMGNTAANGFSGVTFGQGDATTPASKAGSSTFSIAQTNLPNVNFTVSIPAGQGSHAHPSSTPVSPIAVGGDTQTGTALLYGSWGSTAAATLPAMTGTAASGGSGTALERVPPLMLGTWYQRL